MNTDFIGAVNTVASRVAAATATKSNSTTATNTNGAAGAGGEKNMFMNLLVAQLKHQDPMAPQDGTQFVTQLAQFNSLEQLIGIRTALEGLARQATGGGAESTTDKTQG